jgi:hypothetical protein
MRTRFLRYLLVGAAALSLCGCVHYYKITDPASGHVYYTDSVKHKGNGVIKFKDEASKTEVTLSTSEIMKITKDQYKANIHPK